MAEVDSARGLLVLALQDLGDAEAAMTERLGAVRDAAQDAALRDLIAADETRSADQRQVLAAIARELGAEATGPSNIWLRAILDDADNDAKTIAPGSLLDIALAGALRKGKQSERVSYETAIALARQQGLDEAAAALVAIRDAEAETDAALAEAQQRLCANLAQGSL